MSSLKTMSLAKIEATGKVFQDDLKQNELNSWGNIDSESYYDSFDELDSSDYYRTGGKDCQCRTLSVALYGVAGGNEKANVEFVQYFIYSVLKANRDRYKNFYYQDNNQRTFDEWLEAFRRGQVLGDHITLQAFSDGTGIHIGVILDAVIKRSGMRQKQVLNVWSKHANATLEDDYLFIRLKGDESHYVNVTNLKKTSVGVSCYNLRKRKLKESVVVGGALLKGERRRRRCGFRVVVVEDEEDEDECDEDEGDEDDADDSDYVPSDSGKDEDYEEGRQVVRGGARIVQNLSDMGGGSKKSGGRGMMGGVAEILTECRVDEEMKRNIISRLES